MGGCGGGCSGSGGGEGMGWSGVGEGVGWLGLGSCHARGLGMGLGLGGWDSHLPSGLPVGSSRLHSESDTKDEGTKAGQGEQSGQCGGPVPPCQTPASSLNSQQNSQRESWQGCGRTHHY